MCSKVLRFISEIISVHSKPQGCRGYSEGAALEEAEKNKLKKAHVGSSSPGSLLNRTDNAGIFLKKPFDIPVHPF